MKIWADKNSDSWAERSPPFFTMCFWLIIAIIALNQLADEYRPVVDEQLEIYCQMNAVRISTNGEYGWPDYNGNYEEVCSKE